MPQTRSRTRQSHSEDTELTPAPESSGESRSESPQPPPPPPVGHVTITAERFERMMARLDAITTTPATGKSRGKPTPPAKYCGGATELNNFIAQVERNFQSYPDWFDTEKLKVNHALDHLGEWKDRGSESTYMQDPVTWGNAVLRTRSDAFSTWEAFKAALQQQFGDRTLRDQHCATVFSAYQQQKGEKVQAYNTRLRGVWTEAGIDWDETADASRNNSIEYMLYHLVWAGLHGGLKKQIGPLRSEKTTMFYSIAELFVKATNADTNPQAKIEKATEASSATASNPHANQSASGSGGNRKKRNHTQYAKDDKSASGKSETAAAPITKTNVDRRPRAQWVSPETFKDRIAKGVCTRCTKTGHASIDCRTFRPAARPLGASLSASMAGGKAKMESKN